MTTIASTPRILTIDIETTPNLAHVWSLWQDNIPATNVIEAQEVLCFAAKWYGSNEIMFFSQQDSGQESMVKSAHDLLSEADAVVHFNGRRFDVPHLNREFLLLNMNPPAPYRQIDLFRVVKQFKFTSNKLDFVAKQLGLGEKLHTGVDHTLWKACMANDAKAWKTMEKYNKQDVRLTEKLLLRLRPWLGNQLNYGLFTDEFCCSNLLCGSTNLIKEGIYYKQANGYQRYSCVDCGAWTHDSSVIVKTKLRPALL